MHLNMLPKPHNLLNNENQLEETQGKKSIPMMLVTKESSPRFQNNYLMPTKIKLHQDIVACVQILKTKHIIIQPVHHLNTDKQDHL